MERGHTVQFTGINTRDTGATGDLRITAQSVGSGPEAHLRLRFHNSDTLATFKGLKMNIHAAAVVSRAL